MALILVSNVMLTQIATMDCSVNTHSLGLLHLNALRLELHMKTAMQTMNVQTLTTVGTLVLMIEELGLESVFPCIPKMKQLSLDGKLYSLTSCLGPQKVSQIKPILPFQLFPIKIGLEMASIAKVVLHFQSLI